MAVDALPELDLLLGRPEFFADPYPVYHRMRSEQPVAWSERWGCWLLTTDRDVHAALRDNVAFSNVGRQASLLRRLPAEQQDGLGSYSRTTPPVA